jgi:hypothetical protein
MSSQQVVRTITLAAYIQTGMLRRICGPERDEVTGGWLERAA